MSLHLCPTVNWRINSDYARCTSENQSKYDQTTMAQKQKYLRYSQEEEEEQEEQEQEQEEYIFI